jgi:hypothetical protein
MPNGYIPHFYAPPGDARFASRYARFDFDVPFEYVGSHGLASDI